MRPIEKIRHDVAYWEAQEREGREMVEAAKEVLPGLRRTLERLEDAESSRPLGSTAPKSGPDPSPPEVPQLAKGAGAGDPGHTVRLRGQCEDQVEQALEAKHPQSPADLKKFLAEHGQAYSRGAINYALRSLRKQGKIEESHKEGNLRYYEPVKATPAA